MLKALTPLTGTLKPHSNGPHRPLQNAVIGTLAADGWAVTFGTARRGLVQRSAVPLHCDCTTVAQAQDAAHGSVVRRDARKTAEQTSSPVEASPAADADQVRHPINSVKCVPRTPSFAGINFALFHQ